MTSRDHPWRRVADDGVVEAGDLVAFSAAYWTTATPASWDALTRSVTKPPAPWTLRARDALWDRLCEACRPGAHASELLAAYQAVGEQLPPMPVAHGVGVGFDPPVVSQQLPATAAEERLEPGMVLAVTGYVWE